MPPTHLNTLVVTDKEIAIIAEALVMFHEDWKEAVNSVYMKDAKLALKLKDKILKQASRRWKNG